MSNFQGPTNDPPRKPESRMTNDEGPRSIRHSAFGLRLIFPKKNGAGVNGGFGYTSVQTQPGIRTSPCGTLFELARASTRAYFSPLPAIQPRDFKHLVRRASVEVVL